MHERPIGDLVDALQQVGCNIEYKGNKGFPPLQISPAKVDVSKPIQIRGDVSSQFLTALLMALPLTKQQATIEVVGELISKPYIEITLNLMSKFGVHITREGWQKFTISTDNHYRGLGQYFVEGDASSASYFLAAGAIGGGPVKLEGVHKDSIQGDIRFSDALSDMNTMISWHSNCLESERHPKLKLKAIDLDCNHILMPR